MKIEREQAPGRNTFTGYGNGYVEVNRARHNESLVVSGDRLVTAWPAHSVAALSADHMAAIVELKPEIVLLGTGRGAHRRSRDRRLGERAQLPQEH